MLSMGFPVGNMSRPNIFFKYEDRNAYTSINAKMEDIIIWNISVVTLESPLIINDRTKRLKQELMQNHNILTVIDKPTSVMLIIKNAIHPDKFSVPLKSSLRSRIRTVPQMNQNDA
jgi:hypothetical protein